VEVNKTTACNRGVYVVIKTEISFFFIIMC